MRNKTFQKLTEEIHNRFVYYMENIHQPAIYEDIWEPVTIENEPEMVPYDDFGGNIPYNKNEVLLSPKSFYSSLITEKYWNFDTSNANKPAYHSKATIRAIAKELNIEKVDEFFHPVYVEDLIKPIAGFIMYKSYIDFSKEYLEPVVFLFHQFGYFLSKTFTRNDKGITVYIAQFEPYYYENERICISEPLWHLTREEFAKIILKTGFIPSSQSKMCNYPKRNYFALKKNLPMMIDSMYKTGKYANNTKGQNKSALLQIDNNKVKHIHFYTDPSYYRKRVAVYCYEIVPADCINNVEYIVI